MRFFLLLLFTLSIYSQETDNVEEVVTLGTKASIKSGIEKQRNSDQIVSVVDSDSLGEFPDETAAEAVRRLSGVGVENDQGEGRYITLRGMSGDLNAVSMNGALVPAPEGGRKVLLDGLPTELLDSIEVYKSLIPSQDSEGIGGRIEFKTKRATELEKTLFKLKFDNTYNDFVDDFDSPKLSLTYGDKISENFGVIVRTAAEGVSEKALQVDIEKLVEEWGIVSNYKSGDAPKLIHQEPDVSIKVIREHLNTTFKKLLIDRKDQFDEIKNYVSETSPEISDIVDFYQDELMLFERYHIEDQIKKALDRKVWLPSGGHLIIDRTEALTVIDVNTGKFVGKNSLEETVYENNLEAAEEIARQLRLRDIGGIIVIDFIDMESTKKQQSLLNRFKQELAKDKTRTQVFEISRLGLVEMTRKNVAAGLVESFSEECEKCSGRGLIINDIFANKSIEEGLIESEAVVEWMSYE